MGGQELKKKTWSAGRGGPKSTQRGEGSKLRGHPSLPKKDGLQREQGEVLCAEEIMVGTRNSECVTQEE